MYGFIDDRGGQIQVRNSHLEDKMSSKSENVSLAFRQKCDPYLGQFTMEMTTEPQ